MSVPLAVIGVGNWGRNHVRTLSAIPEAEMAVVCDVDAAKLDWIRHQYPSTRVTDTYEEALRGVRGAIIATPAAQHARMALAALEMGVPVLIEKPMALTVRDAGAIVDASKASSVPVLVGHLLLFHPAVIRLKQLIDGGELGTPYYMYSQRVNLGQVRPDENALWSFGPHDVSVAMYLLGGGPVRVTAHGRSYLQPGVEDVVFLTMEFASGVIVHVQMSWLDPHKERRLTVVGSRKMVVFDDMQVREKLKVYDKGVDRPPHYQSYGESLAIREGDIWIPRVSNAEPLRSELEHFVAVVTGDVQPVADAVSGLDVVRVLTAASASLKRGGTAVALDGRSN
jgi:predicted dehydrogenase